MNPTVILDKRLRQAVQKFWSTRETQAQKQGSTGGSRDAGARSAVTGGHQMDGFVSLVRDYLCENGLARADVHCKKGLELPGWYRPEKKWDLLVISDGNCWLASNSSLKLDLSGTITTTARKRRLEAPLTFGRLIAKGRSNHLPVPGWAI